jgi:cytochrome o ubiquinol oxidase subunit II
MKKLSGIIVFLLIILDVYLLGKILISGKNVQILNPAGLIAFQERNLIYLAVSLMLLGVIPVFILAIFVGRKYHAGNAKAAYRPDWDHHTGLQIFFWAFLMTIMFTLSCVVWVSAHALDPHVQIEPNKKPFVVQVIALRYKWLFVYPQQNIATVNFFEFPEKTPVTFEITESDAPMSSFWIPQLGGQIYAMSGMATQTHYIASGTGTYRGASSEINGSGFADMVFHAKSVTDRELNDWVTQVKHSPKILTYGSFKKLSQPSVESSPLYYSSTPSDLFTTIVMQYMAKPANGNQGTTETQSKMEGMYYGANH